LCKFLSDQCSLNISSESRDHRSPTSKLDRGLRIPRPMVLFEVRLNYETDGRHSRRAWAARWKARLEGDLIRSPREYHTPTEPHP